MATSGSSESGFSGRAGFVLRVEVTRNSVVDSNTNSWHVAVMAINRSGYVSYDLSSRPWSISETFNASGSWVPDFRSTDNIRLWTGDVNVNTDSNGNSSPHWTASAGPAGIFGSASTSGSFTANRITQVPDAPPQIDLNGRSSTSLDIGMPQPGDNGGSTVIDYTLNVDDSSGFTSLVVNKTVSPGSRTQTISGLAPNTTYYLRHRARNSAGNSGWSPTLTAKTLVGVPSAPLNPHTQDPTPSGVTVDWDAPASTNGGAITGYVVQRATNSAMTANLTEFTQGTATERTFTDMAPGTTYWFRIIATNSAGRGPTSATTSAETVSGAYVSNGSNWQPAGVYVSDGTNWQAATIAVSDGAVWEDAI